MNYRRDTPKGFNELEALRHGEHIFWFRESPQLKRNITIYPATLTRNSSSD